MFLSTLVNSFLPGCLMTKSQQQRGAEGYRAAFLMWQRLTFQQRVHNESHEHSAGDQIDRCCMKADPPPTLVDRTGDCRQVLSDDVFLQGLGFLPSLLPSTSPLTLKFLDLPLYLQLLHVMRAPLAFSSHLLFCSPSSFCIILKTKPPSDHPIGG